MENKRYDINDIEELLTPRAEFRASSDLKRRIMEEVARKASQGSIQVENNEETGSETKRGAFGFKFIPWIAAACVGGIILLLAILPISKEENSLLAGNDTKPIANVSVENEAKQNEESSDNGLPENMVTPLSESEYQNKTDNTDSRKSAHKEIAKSSIIAQTLNEKSEEGMNSDKENIADDSLDTKGFPAMEEALNARNTITLVSEEDIPVRWENFILTEEEMVLAEKLYQLDFLSQMKEELEMTAYLIKTYNNILEYE